MAIEVDFTICLHMFIDFTLDNIKEAATQIYKAAGDRKVWALHGEMGAGKTTFIHALCENLGVDSAIGSPTYSIINEYKSSSEGTIFHMDWYRLKDEEEALQAGVEDALLSGKLCLVEWPERAEGLLPDDCFQIKIESKNEVSRTISFGEQ
jgi:tRNA threonylcarbamoyladenosine biosynthesis protein TsaE